MDKSETSGLADLFNSLNSTLIVLPPDPDEQIISTALALHLALKNSGKTSQVGYSGSLPENLDVKGLGDLKNSVGQKNLHINLNFLEANLDKVDYEVDHLGKFSLVIHTKSGNLAPDPNQIEYTYSGAEADMVILFAVETLEELGSIYAKEKHFLDNAQKLLITNISRPLNISNHLVQNPGKNYPEIVTDIIKKSQLVLGSDSADNLLLSLYKSTDNLSPQKVGPETFETIAYLLRQGGTIPGLNHVEQPLVKGENYLPQPPFFIQPPNSSGNGHSATTDSSNPVPKDWHSPKIFRSGS